MKKLKLATIVGTRPELIKLSEIVKRADSYFDHIFVHSGQNYDKNLGDIFYDDLCLRRPDIFLNVVGKDLGETIGNVIAKSYCFFREMMPDAVLLLGDTNSALAAISAKRLKIPVFHMEAGNRCFDENLPEEINRRIVDHVSDINLPYTEHARRNLLNEGLRSECVFVTGSPLREVINANKPRIVNSNALDKFNLTAKKYILLSAHREENIDNEKTFQSLINAINSLAQEYNLPIIYSVHPRSAKFLKVRNVAFHDSVRQMPPFSFSDYVSLEQNAFCVVSDSGTLAEEASMLGFAAVSIRTSTERPEAINKGAFVIGNVNAESLLQSVKIATLEENCVREVSDYQDAHVSEKVLRIIQSYTPIINRNIWRKE